VQHHIKLPGIKLKDLLLRTNEREQNVFALNSFTPNGWGQVLAWHPDAVFKHQKDKPHGALRKLEEFTDDQHTKGRLIIGYMSYDFGCQLHNVPLQADNDLVIPLVLVASFDSWISFDKDGAEIHSADPLFTDQVREIVSRPARTLPAQAYSKALQPIQSRSSYVQAYRKVADYIRAGDAYQINLTHRLEGTTNASGRDLFCLLSETSQSDFQAYIEADGFEVLSFSPERFIRIQEQSIETSPIKGTRPRGTTASADKALKADLLANPKDCAELNMITDLMRNDLGAICDVGSVRVAHERVITGYPTLWHAHSTITGKLVPDMSAIAALASVMPGGSITGCPKKRAMEIINALEPQRRNIYTGSLFTIRPDNGELDSSIAIRTMLKKADHLYLSVGGGIVYDSSEEEEYQESLDKAASFMNVGNLSSDVLEQQFGPTTVEVLYQDDKTRTICTKVIATNQILEVSQVTFIQAGLDEFPDTHKTIVAGQSMGKAFRAQGIELIRETQSTYRQAPPDDLSQRFGSNKPVTVVAVSILVGPDKTPYARILETYSPEIVWPE
jgi:para-aminobenzoate synthetase component 1